MKLEGDSNSEFKFYNKQGEHDSKENCSFKSIADLFEKSFNELKKSVEMVGDHCGDCRNANKAIYIAMGLIVSNLNAQIIELKKQIIQLESDKYNL